MERTANEKVPMLTRPILENLDHMRTTFNMDEVTFPSTLWSPADILSDLHLAFDAPPERRVKVQEAITAVLTAYVTLDYLHEARQRAETAVPSGPAVAGP